VFIEAKDDGNGGNNWSYVVQSSGQIITTNKPTNLDIMSKPVDIGFKRSRVRVKGSSFQTSGTNCHLANKTDYCFLCADNIKLHNMTYMLKGVCHNCNILTSVSEVITIVMTLKLDTDVCRDI